MSRMLSKMNLISVVQQLPNEDIETIQGYVEMIEEENKQLKEQLLVTKTNEETFRLEMKDITQTLGLDEDTIFDDVKAFVRSLEIENQKYKDNWNKLKESIRKSLEAIDTIQKLTGNAIENYTPRILTYNQIKDKMHELEQGSDSNEL